MGIAQSQIFIQLLRPRKRRTCNHPLCFARTVLQEATVEVSFFATSRARVGVYPPSVDRIARREMV